MDISTMVYLLATCIITSLITWAFLSQKKKEPNNKGNTLAFSPFTLSRQSIAIGNGIVKVIDSDGYISRHRPWS